MKRERERERERGLNYVNKSYQSLYIYTSSSASSSHGDSTDFPITVPITHLSQQVFQTPSSVHLELTYVVYSISSQTFFVQAFKIFVDS